MIEFAVRRATLGAVSIGQATSQLQLAGYSNISIQTPDGGRSWIGTATNQAGQTVSIRVDSNGVSSP
jgi:hypothetical protein